MACLLFASKLEDTPRKLRDISICAQKILVQYNPDFADAEVLFLFFFFSFKSMFNIH